MLNKVCIMGRLVRDPEFRRTQSGIAVTTMRIAVDRDFKSQDGTKQADFFDVVAWRGTAEFVSRYFSKGRMMVVEGRLQTRDWTDREGNKRINTEIVADNIYFGDSRRDGPNGEYGGYGAAPGYGASGYGSGNSGYGNSNGYGSGNSGYGNSSGYGSGNSGAYGNSNGYGSGNSNAYGSGGYGYGGYSGGYGSGGYGAYSSGNSGGYGSGFGGFDNGAASGASADASGSDSSANADSAAPAKDAAPNPTPSSFAEVADDDGDLPF